MFRRREMAFIRHLFRRLIIQISISFPLIMTLFLLTSLNIFIYTSTELGYMRSGALQPKSMAASVQTIEQSQTRTTSSKIQEPGKQTPIMMGRRFDTIPRLPPQLSSFAAGFCSTTWKLEREQYDKRLRENVGLIEQGRKSFKDVHTYDHQGVLLPKLERKTTVGESAKTVWEPGALPDRSSEELRDYEKHESQLRAYDPAVLAELEEAAGTAEFCDAADADYTPTKDAACRAYLQNPANWLALKPLSSILDRGRTIKFLLSLRHGNMTAVLKISQMRFLLEPASEIVAYHMDRMLQFRRVPPTVWVQFPIDYIKAAASTLGSFYAQWVHVQALRFKHVQRIISPCKDARVAAALGVRRPLCIYVSLQLWMWDVDAASETIFSGFMPRRLFSRAERTKEGERAWERERAAVDAAAISGLVARERWDQMAFDAIVENPDRWEGHNMFALAACGAPNLPCRARRRKKRANELPSKSSQRFIYIDQGSSFYKEQLNQGTFFSLHRKRPYCLVRRQTVERLERIALCALRLAEHNGTVADEMRVAAETPIIARNVTGIDAKAEKKQVGKAIYRHLLKVRFGQGIGVILYPRLIEAACRRIWSILAHRTFCLKTSEIKDKVFF